MEQGEDQKDSVFGIQDCNCGSEDCTSVNLYMINPIIAPTDDEDNPLACVIHFPVEQIQDLVDCLRECAREKGVEIK